MRATPSLPSRLWRIAAGTSAAIQAAAMAADLVVRRFEATPGGSDRDEEQLMLVREIEACELRLRLLPPFENDERDQSFRRDLQERRDAAAAKLMRARATTG